MDQEMLKEWGSFDPYAIDTNHGCKMQRKDMVDPFVPRLAIENQRTPSDIESCLTSIDDREKYHTREGGKTPPRTPTMPYNWNMEIELGFESILYHLDGTYN